MVFTVSSYFQYLEEADLAAVEAAGPSGCLEDCSMPFGRYASFETHTCGILMSGSVGHDDNET